MVGEDSAAAGVEGESTLALDISHFAITMKSEHLPEPRGPFVRVISRRRLREFWEARKNDRNRAERDFCVWHKLAKNADWLNFGSLRQTFGSADQVGNCIVFDVGNNRYRLIGRVNYRKGIVYVLRVMDHAEYDKALWIEACGCHKPPPKKNRGREGRPRPTRD